MPSSAFDAVAASTPMWRHLARRVVSALVLVAAATLGYAIVALL